MVSEFPSPDDDGLARAMLQQAVNRLCDAVLHGRADLMRAVTADPVTITTRGSRVTLRHDDAFAQTVADFGMAVRNLGATDFLGCVEEARFLPEGRLHGRFRNWYLRDGTPACRDFATDAALVKDGQRYLFAEIRNHVDHSGWPLPEGTAIGADTPPGAGGGAFDDAEFATFLTDISDPFRTGDIARWRNRLSLPFTMVTPQGPLTLDSDEAVTRNFEVYMAGARITRLDLVVRTPLDVVQNGDGAILATYRTELLSHGKRLVDPYVSTAHLHLTPDGWKLSSVENALGPNRPTGLQPTRTGDQP